MTIRCHFPIALVVLSGVLALGPLAAFPALADGYTDATGQLAQDADALGQRSVLPPAWGTTLAAYAPVYRYEEAWMLAALLDPRDHPFTVIAWPDVPPGYWALQAVNQVVGVGILHDEHGLFNGDREITRAEFVVALDRVLTSRAIPPPPPRRGAIRFSDVHGQQGLAIDRAANRWQFIRRSGQFHPDGLLTRGEAVKMLARAAPLVDPTFSALLSSAPAPVPTVVPTPAGTAQPTPAPSDLTSADAVTPPPASASSAASGSLAVVTPATSDASASPDVEWTLPPIAWHWQAEPVLVALEAADGTILNQSPAIGYPGGGEVEIAGTSTPVEVRFHFGTNLLLNGSGSGLYQVFGDTQGLYMANLAPGTDVGIGGGLVLNSQAVVGSSGATSPANRTFFGVGPAGLLSSRLGFATLDLALQVQAGGVSSTTGSGGFGLGYEAQLHGPIGFGALEVAAGVEGQLVDPGSGAYDFVSGLVAGLGGHF